MSKRLVEEIRRKKLRAEVSKGTLSRATQTEAAVMRMGSSLGPDVLDALRTRALAYRLDGLALDACCPLACQDVLAALYDTTQP